MPFFNYNFCIVGDKGVIQNQDLSVDHTAIQLKEGKVQYLCMNEDWSKGCYHYF